MKDEFSQSLTKLSDSSEFGKIIKYKFYNFSEQIESQIINVSRHLSNELNKEDDIKGYLEELIFISYMAGVNSASSVFSKALSEIESKNSDE
jgi:hypothetical protein